MLANTKQLLKEGLKKKKKQVDTHHPLHRNISIKF